RGRRLTSGVRAPSVFRIPRGTVQEAHMPLDPQAQKVVEALAALNLKPIKDSTPTEARESMRTRTAALGPFEEVAAVADHRVPVTGGEITVRLYGPAGGGAHRGRGFCHGRRWVLGYRWTPSGPCRR